MICTPVQHCHDAFAVSFVFGSVGGTTNGTTTATAAASRTGKNTMVGRRTFKLVYSGDTEPCEALIRDGSGADIFIHEATFEPEMVRDARSKRHSTVSEALSVARRAGAKRVVLTHFSQRYPKFPKLDEHELESGGVAVAFDGCAVGLDDFQGDDFALGRLTNFFKSFFDD